MPRRPRSKVLLDALSLTMDEVLAWCDRTGNEHQTAAKHFGAKLNKADRKVLADAVRYQLRKRDEKKADADERRASLHVIRKSVPTTPGPIEEDGSSLAGLEDGDYWTARMAQLEAWMRQAKDSGVEGLKLLPTLGKELDRVRALMRQATADERSRRRKVSDPRALKKRIAERAKKLVG